MATGVEMMMRALLPKGMDPGALMIEAQAKIAEVVQLCQVAERRLAAMEQAIARIEDRLTPVLVQNAPLALTHDGE